MRNLKECQAEVFRRSEKRIQVRRLRRRRIFTACVPLALSICVVAALAAPRLFQSGNKSSEAEAAMGGVSDGYFSLACAIREVCVEGTGISLAYTDGERNMAIYNCLTGRQTDGGEDPKNAPVPESGKENASEIDPPEASGKTDGTIADRAGNIITVTVTMTDGSRRDFLLEGNLLTDVTSEKIRTLSPLQLEELRLLLGLDKP